MTTKNAAATMTAETSVQAIANAMANGEHYGQAYAKVRGVGANMFTLPPAEAFALALKHSGVASAHHEAFAAGWKRWQRGNWGG